MISTSNGHPNGNGHPPREAEPPTPRLAVADLPVPRNVDIECALLGMVMHDPGQLHEVLQVVDAPDFFREAHQVVFRAIKERYDAGKEVSMLLVIDDVDSAGSLKAVGGDDAFVEMMHQGQCSWHAKEYASVVKQHAIARRLIDAGQEMLSEACSRQFTAADLLARAEGRIFSIAQDQLRDETVACGIVADEAWGVLMRRHAGEVEGVTTGLADLDKIVGCLPNSGLVILAARPAMGKTSIAMNICEHNAIDMDVPTLFVSLEMCRHDLGLRLLASRSRVGGRKIQRAHTLTDEDFRRLSEARARLQDCRLFIDHTPHRTVSQIAANARLKQAQHKIGLVVVDYMSLINMQERKGESRQEAVARTSRQLKDLARTLAIPVLVLCQLNRAVEGRKDHRPCMSDLRESGQIEQDADLILLLHRPEKYSPNDRPGEADLLVAKNRFGETGCARLAFNGELTRFDNLAYPQQVRDEWNPEF